MENVWEATKLALIIYAMTAVVSFLVACIIRMTFAAIRLHSASGAAPADSPAKSLSQSPPKDGA